MDENTNAKQDEKSELKRLREENEYLRTENAVLKKLRALMIEEQRQKRKRKQLSKCRAPLKAVTGSVYCTPNIGTLNRTIAQHQDKHIAPVANRNIALILVTILSLLYQYTHSRKLFASTGMALRKEESAFSINKNLPIGKREMLMSGNGFLWPQNIYFFIFENGFSVLLPIY